MIKVLLPSAGRTPRRTFLHRKNPFTNFPPNSSLDQLLEVASAAKPNAAFNKAGTESYGTVAALPFLA